MKNFVDRIPELSRIGEISRNSRSMKSTFSPDYRCMILICSRSKTLKVKSRMSAGPNSL